ncbi:hypothetical protein CPB84DRAFT_1852106 [Gymnopilus junonius]|uniref:Uncharacterized protein n=1 Tax=Gymnopilus junonius TaxID=109634 RepID=A0A9P5NES1_GYMJU|nr:hypothetical protein CPB84DRAFT_1852106 [Gymnopilus junonius]
MQKHRAQRSLKGSHTAFKVKASWSPKKSGTYTSQARKLAHALFKAGCSSEGVGDAMLSCTQTFGVKVKNRMSARMALRARDKGGYCGLMQLGREITNSSGIVFTSSGFLLTFWQLAVNRFLDVEADGGEEEEDAGLDLEEQAEFDIDEDVDDEEEDVLSHRALSQEMQRINISGNTTWDNFVGNLEARVQNRGRRILELDEMDAPPPPQQSDLLYEIPCIVKKLTLAFWHSETDFPFGQPLDSGGPLSSNHFSQAWIETPSYNNYSHGALSVASAEQLPPDHGRPGTGSSDKSGQICAARCVTNELLSAMDKALIFGLGLVNTLDHL